MAFATSPRILLGRNISGDLLTTVAKLVDFSAAEAGGMAMDFSDTGHAIVGGAVAGMNNANEVPLLP